MQILKWFGIRLLILITLGYAYLSVCDLYDNRPFKFERYRSREEFRKGLEEKFPLGSDVTEALLILQKSMAKCEVYDHRNEVEWQKEHKYLLACQYNSGFFSLHPLENYRLYLYADANLKIIEHWTSRTTGMVI